MEKEITTFIENNKIASISCLDAENNPYCFHCFYVFDKVNNLILFKSSSETYHSRALSEHHQVAGSILPDKLNLIALKGIQFTASVITDNFPGNIAPDIYYHKKLPFALTRPGRVWCIRLDIIKMTDNTNVFGKKLRWQRDSLEC